MGRDKDQVAGRPTKHRNLQILANFTDIHRSAETGRNFKKENKFTNQSYLMHRVELLWLLSNLCCGADHRLCEICGSTVAEVNF